MRVSRPHAPLASALIAVLTLGFSTLALPLRAEPIPAEEAKLLLRRAQEASTEPGSYRTQTVSKTDKGTTTVTTLSSYAPGRPAYLRTETVIVQHGPPSKTVTRLTIRNAEGRWQFYGNKAVLSLQPFDGNRVNQAIQQASGAAKSDQPAPDGPTQRLANRILELAKHTQVEGERFTEGDRSMVRVTRSLDEHAQKILEEIADEEIAVAKKQLSLGKRILVNTVLAAKGGIGKALPVREVFVIDSESGRMISSEMFTGDGKSRKRRVQEPERIADLPLETFALPAGTEVIRPRNLEESIEITEKLEKERRKAEGSRK